MKRRWVWVLVAALWSRSAVASPDLARHRASESSSLYWLAIDWLFRSLWLVVPWLAVMAILVLVGRALSRVALRAIEEPEALAPRVRKSSRLVLAVSGVYFYLSLPMLLVLVVATGGGAIAVCLYVGRLPLLVPIAAGAAVLATFGGIVQALLMPPRFDDLGAPLALEDHPRLRALLSEVATSVGTRPPDTVYVTPGTTVAVEERAGLWRSARHADVERRLIMGVGLFEGMTQLQLRSVLAHEHGHFRNEDTAGGGFALRLRRSIRGLLEQLAQSRYAALNPAWWFMHAYLRMYYGISEGASRVQEVLADRWAIRAYGSRAFVEGFRHVVVRTIDFAYRVEAVVTEVVQHERDLANVYQYKLEHAEIRDTDRAAEIEKALSRNSDRYDSHPAPKQRIAWAEGMAVEREPQPEDDAPVWDLFDDRDRLERAVTIMLRAQIRVVRA